MQIRCKYDELVSPKKLKAHPKNRNKHKKEQIERLAKILEYQGWRYPVKVSKQSGYITSGHGRVLAAKKLKCEVPINYQDYDNDDMEYADVQSDNAIAAWSELDMDGINDDLDSLADDFDRELLGIENFDEKENDKYADKDADSVPENVEPVVKLGQIWKLGEHRLMCGDATQDVDALMDGNRADMIFTDPPYGVGYDGGIQFKDGGVKKGQREKLSNDASASIYLSSIPVMNTICDGPIYTWFAGTKAKEIYEAIEQCDGTIHAMIVWVKNGGYGALNACYKQKHEPCLFWKPKKSTLRWSGDTTENTIWDIKKDGVNKLHPTQKPVSLAERAIKNHKCKSVLDLFGGSGSTLIACEKTNRKCYMMELEPKYCDVIIKRYEDFTGNKAEIIHDV